MQAVPKRQRRKRAAQPKGPGVTPAGLAYMKCATSPNDFDTDSFQGIPDTYDGRVVTKRYMSVTSPGVSSATLDTYIVLLPVPGVAYYYGTRTANTQNAITLTAVQYSDTATLFPANYEGTVVNAFRHASNVIEVVPTANAMTWNGAIEVWKFNPTGGATNFAASGAAYYAVTGMEAMDSIKPTSVLPFNHGCYSVCAPNEPTVPFTEVMTSTAASRVIAKMTSNPVTFAGDPFLGLSSMEGVIIKFPATLTAVNTALVRTWACVEYQVSSTSILYEYSHLSPAHDPVALALVRRFLRETPSAVPYFENENFWKRFLSWVSTISGALKIVPGPVGQVAEIANLVSKTADMYL